MGLRAVMSAEELGRIESVDARLVVGDINVQVCLLCHIESSYVLNICGVFVTCGADAVSSPSAGVGNGYAGRGWAGLRALRDADILDCTAHVWYICWPGVLYE